MGKQVVTFKELDALARVCADIIRRKLAPQFGGTVPTLHAYPVPRGGIPAALALQRHIDLVLVSTALEADIIVDDLIDSGATMERFGKKPFFALLDKRNWPHGTDWIVFPWEGDADGGIEDNVRRLLQYVGEDTTREGLLETPRRVAAAWQSWCSGYDQDPADVLKVFEDGAGAYDEMVVVKDIPLYSKCEHHLADIFGTATIAYIPNEEHPKIVGLSKLSRLLDVYARRLQVQERLTGQVADALMEHLKPKGAGVVIKARHMCMESRGIRQQGHHTITSALRGAFKEQSSTRAEFMSLAL